MSRFTLRAALGAALLTASVALVGCAPSVPDATHQDAVLTITDPWVKAVDEGMTAAFGTLLNHSDTELTVVGVETDAATEVELHETVQDASGISVMRENPDGFVIPAHGTFLLEPGGNHFMLMGVTAPLVPGAEVSLRIRLADGGTIEVVATVKDYQGANEEYDHDGHGDHDHDHGDHDDHDGSDH